MVEAAGEGEIIPALPDGIAVICLAHLPRLELTNLSAVTCKSRRELFISQEFYNVRAKTSFTDQWLLVLCKDSGIFENCDDAVSIFAVDFKSRSGPCLFPVSVSSACNMEGVTSVQGNQLFVIVGECKIIWGFMDYSC